MQFEMTCATNIGYCRSNNEDCIRIIPEINLAVLADGMGGHKAGDIASRMAVDTLCDWIQRQQFMVENQPNKIKIDYAEAMATAFSTANQKVYTTAQKLAHCERMGTTLLAAIFKDEQVYVGHIGDSRLYHFAKGKLAQLTVDHTLAAELAQEGATRNIPQYSYHLLRKSLGIEYTCEPDFLHYMLNKNETYLFCSDGLNGAVDDHDIETTLSLHHGNPESCVEALIGIALEHGGPDNISIILVNT